MTSCTPKLIIFDLDKTLATCNVSFSFGRSHYKKGKISFLSMIYLVFYYFLQNAGFVNVNRLHEACFKKFFLGRCSKLVDKEVALFLKESKNLFREELLKRLEEAKKSGATIWLQSSSPECLVAPIARSLGIDHYMATSYATDEMDCFSHVGSIVDGHAKQKEVQAYLQKEHIHPAEVIAYSDSMLDLPLLETVGCPIAVCPDFRLHKIAVKRSWQIIQT